VNLTVPPEWIDWRAKGLWWPGPAVTLEEFAAARHSLFSGAFTWPVLVADGAAVARNIDTLARFCARHGMEFAPHGKTTMAPSLFAAQLRAGATAITVATANQLLACRALGVPRVLLANELLDPAVLRWLAGEVERGFDVLCYVDSTAGVRVMADAVASVPGDRPLRVLAELGYPGGRTGCRNVKELADVARAVAREPRLALAGVAAYAGDWQSFDAYPSFSAPVDARLLVLTALLALCALLPFADRRGIDR
jgi:D-serine deaminase-like pyridoxal phosphate-dependent protein